MVLPILVLVLLFSACGEILIHDEIVYGLKGPGFGAVAVHTLTTDQANLTQAQWDGISNGMLCESAQAFGDWKSDIEKLCSYHSGECVEQVQAKLRVFFNRIGEMENESWPNH